MEKYIKKHKGMVLALVLVGIPNALLGVFSTFCIQYITEIVVAGEKDRIKNMFFMTLIFFIGMALIVTLYMYVKNKFSMKIMSEIRQDLFGSILNKDVTAYYKQNTSYYTSLFHNDLQVVETTGMAYFILIKQIEEILFSLFYAFWQNVVVGVLLLLIGILGTAVPLLAQKVLEKSNMEHMNEAAKHNTTINDDFHGFEVIKNYQAEKNIIKRYLQENRRFGQKKFESQFAQGTVGGITQDIVLTFQILTIVSAGIMTLYGKISISFLTVVIALSSSVIGAMCTAIESMVEIKSGKPVCRKVFAEIEGQKEEQEVPCAEFHEKIELKNVSFSYPETEREVLHQANAAFENGKRYALVGGSGSGKSTLAKLLLRYYNNYQGDIELDKTDMKQIPVKAVMEQMAVIPQNVFIFEDTFRNNITLYHEYKDEEVLKAVRKAGLEAVLQRLDNGLETVLKEGGANLSGGEKQRISIARAFLHQRNLWVLDEATSSLDNKMAYQIEKTVLDMPEITVIMITHHYNKENLQKCDEILVLEKGNIVEKGTFDQLLEDGGQFRQLYELGNQ
ncbi:MAG: ABC transporter ATP-binding protein [Clostridiales bacterium]|nr:ABC transporter ATP-binding protein [Clostridiales bacterium]